MPGIFYQPLHRRSFLKRTVFAATVLALERGKSIAQPAAGSKEAHLALLSDTHVPGDRKNGYRGFSPWDNLKQIVPEVVAARPAGVILCGDAARLEGKTEDYREVQALLQPIAEAAPVCLGLGNHDDRANFAAVFAESPGKRQSVPGKHVVLLEYETVRVVVLDSLLYVNKVAGWLGRPQRNWLAEALPRLADRPLVLFVHHTLGEDEGDLLDADRLFALLRPFPQVKAIFYGHSHVWELGERQGVKLINLPAVGYNFRDRDPVGWVDARFRLEGVELVLHAFAGNREGDGKTVFLKWA